MSILFIAKKTKHQTEQKNTARPSNKITSILHLSETPRQFLSKGDAHFWLGPLRRGPEGHGQCHRSGGHNFVLAAYQIVFVSICTCI